MIRGAEALQMARFGPGLSRFRRGKKIGPKEAPTKHDQAPEGTVETHLALAHTSMSAFGLKVETQLTISIKSMW